MPAEILPVIATGVDVGLRLTDLVRARSKRQGLLREAFGRVRPLLTKLEKADDPLVGYWRLRDWTYTSSHLPPYIVSGGLAVHLLDEKSTWIGRMCLEYHKGPYPHPSAVRGFPPPFIATYEVAFQRAADGSFNGVCHMLERVDLIGPLMRAYYYVREGWPSNYKWRGGFDACTVEGVGAARVFSGQYQNYPVLPESASAHFSFHLPVRWAELDALDFGK